MKKSINKSCFKEKHLVFQNFPGDRGGSGGGGWGIRDLFGDAGKGIGSGFEGVGKAFRALGEVIKSLGGAVDWIVNKGPKSLYYVFLRGKDLGADGWDKLTAPDEPEELSEYDLDSACKLPAPNSNEDDEDYDKRADVKLVWQARINLLRGAIHTIKTAYAPQEKELSSLNTRIKHIYEGRVARVVSQDKLTRHLEKIRERKELGDFPEGSPALRGLNKEEKKILAQLRELDADIDIGKQDWYVIDPNTGSPVVDHMEKDAQGNERPVYKTAPTDILARRDELEDILREPRAKIKLYKDQIEGIEYWKDPSGKRKKADDEREADRKAREEDIHKPIDKDDDEEKVKVPTYDNKTP